MIQSLRKEKGGYALLYVMVVVMVLCAISVMICTVALRNLQSQEASVRRMQDLYAAEGEIEKIKAQIETMETIRETGSTAETLAKDEYKRVLGSYKTTEPKINAQTYLMDIEGKIVKIEARTETVTVTAVLSITLNIETTEETTEPVISPATYSISTSSVTFTSYTIENTGGGS